METLAAWLPIVGIILIFWLLLIRPAQKRQRALNSIQDSLSLGDPVVTSSGIFGTVASIGDDDKVGLEVAAGVVITVARAAIVGVTKPDVDDEAEPAASDLEQEQE